MSIEQEGPGAPYAPDAPDVPKIETPVECTVKINGQELVHSINSVKLKQYINDHHVLKVTISPEDGGYEAISDPKTYMDMLGQSISFGIKPVTDKVDASSTLEFIGIVTEVRFDNGIDDINMLVITAKSPTIAMDGAKRNSFSSELTASDAISSVLGNYQITLGSIDATSKTMPYSVQYRETDYEYIKRLAASAGKFAFYDGKEFRLVSASSSDEHELSWRENLGSFSLGLGTVSCNYKGSSYNYEADSLHAESTDTGSSKTSLSSFAEKSFKISEEIYSEPGYWDDLEMVQDAKALEDVLKNEKARAMGKMVNGHGFSIIPSVSVGHCVKIDQMGAFNEQFWVTEVVHIFSKTGKYHNQFKCVPLDIAYPTNPATLAKTLAKIQRAKVTGIVDPEALGRIKVEFLWDDSVEIWARYVSPHAGEERGFFCLPEIGDEVLVAFEEGDPDRPIIIGSLYNKTQIQPFSADDENTCKMFKTKSGNQIVFTDESGGEKIEISHGDGKNALVLDLSGPSITITSEGGDITLEGSNIILKADDGITLDAGGDLKAEAGANMEIKAGATSKIEASATMDIKGATINLN